MTALIRPAIPRRLWAAACVLLALTLGCDDGQKTPAPLDEVPRVVIDSPQNGGVVSFPELLISGRATDDVVVRRVAWTLNGGAQRELPDGVGPDGTFSFTVTLQTGANTITVMADDNAENRGTASVSSTYAPPGRSDTQKPKLSIATPADDSEVSAPLVRVSGTASDDIGVVRLTWSLNGQTEQDQTLSLKSGAFAFDVTLVAGLNTLAVFAWDQVGNRTARTVQVTFVDPDAPDTTPPVVLITAPEAGETEGPEVGLSGSAVDDREVVALSLTVDDEAPIDLLPSLLEGEFAAALSLEPGEHTLVVSAWDAAGNEGSGQVVVSVPAPAPVLVTVDPAIVGQVLGGAGALVQARPTLCAGFAEAQEAVLDRAADAGIRWVRVLLPSGTERPDDPFLDHQAGTLSWEEAQALRYAAVNDDENPETAGAFAWGRLDRLMSEVVLPLKARVPELRLVVAYEDAGPSEFEHLGAPAEYAELWLRAFEHLEAVHGLVPDALEPLSRPDQSAWTAAEVGAGLAVAAATLQAAGFTPELHAPSTAAAAEALTWLEQLNEVPEAAGLLERLVHERADGSGGELRAAIAAGAEAAGLGVGLVGHPGADVDTLIDDLVDGGHGTWGPDALLACPEAGVDGLLGWSEGEAPGADLLLEGPARLWTHATRALPAGAVRVEAAVEAEGWRAVGALDGGDQVTVVVRVPEAASVELAGLPAGRVTVWSVDEAGQAALPEELEVVADEALLITAPAAGLLLIAPAAATRR